MDRMDETIEVLYSLTDKRGTYSKLAGVSMCSLLENTERRVRLHLFHDGSVKGESEKKFRQMVSTYGQEIKFYNVQHMAADRLFEAKSIMSEAVSNERYTEAALYRLMAPQILSKEIGRVIYLDADTLVNVDIGELWQEEIGSCGMAAVFERDILKNYNACGMGAKEEIKGLLDYWETLGVKVEGFFNSGVLLMDLNIMRQRGDFLLPGLRMLAESKSENNWYDQNILNFYFAQDASHLPWRYNIVQGMERDFNNSREVKGIYHYLGHSLKMDENDLRDTLYYDYFLKTPWATGRFLCHFYHEMEKVQLKDIEKHLIAMRELLTNLSDKQLVIAASIERQAMVNKLFVDYEDFHYHIDEAANKNPDTSLEKKKERDRREREALGGCVAPQLPEGTCFFSLGSEEKLNLNLPYDVDSHFYLFFVEDYVSLKVPLERAGLEEKGHYMDGTLFIRENPGDGGILNITKFFEGL